MVGTTNSEATACARLTVQKKAKRSYTPSWTLPKLLRSPDQGVVGEGQVEAVLCGPTVSSGLDIGRCDVGNPQAFGYEDLLCGELFFDPLTTRVERVNDKRGDFEMSGEGKVRWVALDASHGRRLLVPSATAHAHLTA